MSNIKYGAVIVAAGMSTRMKQFKQLMNIGNMSISERVIVNFKNAGVTDIAMVTGFNADKLENSLKGFEIHFIRNECYETTQMFDSVKLGLSYMLDKCDRVFFCPVDVPFFTQDTVRFEMESDADVVVPMFGNKDGHPLLLSNDVIPSILKYEGDKGLKGAYESLDGFTVLRMQVEDEGAVIDADTRDDYKKLLELHNKRIMHADVKLNLVSTTKFFDEETVTLLKCIELCGNVREACERCRISYSKGWGIISNCEEKLGIRIVERKQGGQSGGTAVITKEGETIIRAYEEIKAILEETAEDAFDRIMKEFELI